MSATDPQPRNRGDWAPLMEGILQALGRSLDRCPEIAPSSFTASAPVYPPLEKLDQHLLHLHGILARAEEEAEETDQSLAVAAEALRRWLGQELKESDGITPSEASP